MRPRSVLALMTLLLLATACSAADVVLKPVSGGEVLNIGAGAKAKEYVRVDASGATFRLDGAGELSGWVRAHYGEGEKGPKTLTLAGLPGAPLELVFKGPSKTGFTVEREGRPSGGVKLAPMSVSADGAELVLTADQEPLYVRLLWDAVAPVTKPEPEPASWKTGGSVGLETIYDDNFLRYSDDYLDDFHAGSYPYKFQIDRQDSHIFAPHMELYAQRRLVGERDTRFRFRVKRWQYVQGDIKSNMSFDYGIRHFFNSGNSLEFSYQYAPEQYIRELSDRSPLVPPSDDLLWEEFRYTRNVFFLTWRQKLNKKVSLKVVANRSLRYYNRPFMENDIKDLGLRGTVYWSVHRNWRITADYGYTDAPARGADEVGELVEFSDNSDPSYNRDLYQIDVRWRPRFAKKFFKYVSLRGQHQAYWFTSSKELLDDPYHVGRIDRVYSAQLVFDRPLPNGIGLRVGVKYTERTVESPWKGDIAEDKDYNQRRYWIGLTYKL